MKLFGLHIIKDKAYRRLTNRLALVERFYEQEKRSTAFNLRRITALETECTRLKAQLDNTRLHVMPRDGLKRRKISMTHSVVVRLFPASP